MLQSEMPAWSSYNYGFCNPLIFNDPSGMQPEDTQKEEQKPKPYKPEPEKGTKSGFMEASTEDGLYMGVSAMFELEEVTIRAKPKNSWKDRLSNIGKGIVVGLVIAVAVAGIVVTGGAALAAMGISVSAASMATVGTALTITGGAFTAYNTVQSLRERDLLNNEISQEEADYNLGMGIGGMLAGPMAKLGGKFGGKSIAGKIFKPKTGAGVTQPDAAKGVTRSLDDLSSLRGATWKEAESLIPKDWIRGSMKKGEGIKFSNPNKRGEMILLEKGWPGATDPLHAGPYMRISRDGQIIRIPLEGNPTLK